MRYVHSIHNITIRESFSLWTGGADAFILHYEVRFGDGFFWSRFFWWNGIYNLRI